MSEFKDNQQEVSETLYPPHLFSPITQIGDWIFINKDTPHNLIEKVRPIIEVHKGKFALFLDAVEVKNYSLALCLVCANGASEALDLVKILFPYKN